MKAKNQTANQILDFLREAEHQYPDWYQEATIVITDRGGEDPAAAFGFFKAEAEKEQDRKNNGPWAYSDEIEDHQIHIWRTDDDPDTRKENAAAEEIETLKKALKMANAERDRAEERLQAALRDLNTTKAELIATIDASNDLKPEHLTERDHEVLRALLDADADDSAREIYRHSHVIRGKLINRHRRLNSEEERDLLNLIEMVSDGGVPWTREDREIEEREFEDAKKERDEEKEAE